MLKTAQFVRAYSVNPSWLRIGVSGRWLHFRRPCRSVVGLGGANGTRPRPESGPSFRCGPPQQQHRRGVSGNGAIPGYQKSLTQELDSEEVLVPHAEPTILTTRSRPATTRVRATRYIRAISTLDASKLTLGDVIDISGVGKPSVRLAHRNGNAGEKGSDYYSFPSGRTYSRFIYARKRYPHDRESQAFPAGTKGFLYFERKEGALDAAGQVRFKVLDSRDLDVVDGSVSGGEKKEGKKVKKKQEEEEEKGRTESRPAPAATASVAGGNPGPGPTAQELFARGKDLPMFNAPYLPWNIPLLTIRRLTSKDHFWALLKRDGFITERSELEISNLCAVSPDAPSDLLRDLVQDVTEPFVANFRTTKALSVPLLQKERAGRVSFGSGGFGKARCSGKAFVRFEISPEEMQPGDGGPRALCLRVLKFVEPPTPTDQFFQKEGELVKQFSSRKGVPAESIWVGRSEDITLSSIKLLEEFEQGAKKKL